MKDKLEEMLIRHEGLELMPYHCTAGKLTIGIGRNIQDRGINEAEARFMLKNDIQQIYVQLVKYKWFVNLSDIRKDIIVDMAFMGVGKLLGFKKMIICLQNEDYTGAAQEMLGSRWATQVGERATELAAMMIENRYIRQ